MNERFWSRVDAAGDCWLWTGAIDRDGYGTFAARSSRKVRAHRFAYEDLVGEIPKGLVIDHLCRTRHCVNPDHMEPVSIGDNVRRGYRPRRTHCKRGHRIAGDNEMFVRRSSGKYADSTWRQCRACWLSYFRGRSNKGQAAAAA